MTNEDVKNPANYGAIVYLMVDNTDVNIPVGAYPKIDEVWPNRTVTPDGEGGFIIGDTDIDGTLEQRILFNRHCQYPMWDADVADRILTDPRIVYNPAATTTRGVHIVPENITDLRKIPITLEAGLIAALNKCADDLQALKRAQLNDPTFVYPHPVSRVITRSEFELLFQPVEE